MDPKQPPRRNEWLLVSFTASTNIADAVTRVALPLLVVRLTHSPILISGVAAVFSLPWLVTALHVGVLVDRHDRRRLMVAAETSRLIAAGSILACVAFDVVSVPVVYVAALVLGVAEVVASLSSSSIVPSAVPRSRWETANARITGMEYLFNTFLGAPFGGVLVAIGFGLAFGVAGVLYVAGALMLALLVGQFAAVATVERRPARVEIRNGLSFLFGQRLLRTMAGLAGVMAGSWAAWYALIPAYAVGGPLALNSREYGLLLTCLGAGGVVGTVVVSRLNRLVGRRWTMFTGIAGTFALVAAPAMLPQTPSSAWGIGVAAFFAGAGGTLWTVNSRVISQSLVPNELLGRFNAASRLVSWGSAPVAAALAGVLAELVSYRFAFGALATLCALSVPVFLRVITPRTVAGADARVPHPTAVAASATE